MIVPNPIEGTALHAVGGISASTCYLPYHKTKAWSWTSFWLVQALFAWIIVPTVLGYLTVPGFFSILANAPGEVVLSAFLLGACYGFGGMSFGYATRHIGYSLTYTISIGLSAIIGTMTPLIMKGEVMEYFARPGGDIILTAMGISMLGVAMCGWAGFKKEREIGQAQHFNMRKGLILTIVGGFLSAVFNISLEIGQPIADMAAANGAGHFEGNAKLIVSTAGCFMVNLIWFMVLAVKQGNLKEMSFRGGLGKFAVMKNFMWSAFAGVLWCFQFFFYGIGHVRMGNFQFASWVIHMSMLIFFSFIVGVAMKEWKNVSRKTYILLIAALVILCTSFLIMTYGTVKGQAEMEQVSTGGH
ncbi:L-rhamnose/proton symporter RhaT [Botryobacter ruber]|uniref:L-rhamnose/proton symporter RhaT n=1 Tax=Botryobacter ruber TaxID=2171629 RepID=UPI000E0AAFB6|nr:L-rhamnose/proton symporter RhaT [Botryobacter ruber]